MTAAEALLWWGAFTSCSAGTSWDTSPVLCRLLLAKGLFSPDRVGAQGIASFYFFSTGAAQHEAPPSEKVKAPPVTVGSFWCKANWTCPLCWAGMERGSVCGEGPQSC